MVLRQSIAILGVAGALAVAGQAQATVLSLPSPPPPSFPWSALVPGSGAGQVRATAYLHPDGSAGGGIANFTDPVLWVDASKADRPFTVPCNVGQRCLPAGSLSFQSVLWAGLQNSITVNRLGAAVMGGFTPSAVAPAGTEYGFLQIYSDASFPGGTVDGGGAAGKANGQVPGWTPFTNSLLGWNYQGGAVPFDYLDIPFDRVGQDPLETVSFETALAAFTPGSTTIDVLAAFNWSFTTHAGAGLTGAPIALDAGAPQLLMSTYAQAFPGFSYRYLGGVASAAVPEPGAWTLLIGGFGACGLIARARRRRALAAPADRLYIATLPSRADA